MYSSILITDAYRNYYEKVLKPNHNNPGLLSAWGEHLADLETQILCSTDGEPVEGSKRFTADGEVWGNIRWPHKANTNEPEFTPRAISYDIGKRMVAVGTTWWNWRHRQSWRLGFDVDSIIGHAEGVGVSQEVIDAVARIDIPWLEIVRSTRGKGLHLYVVFGPPYPTTMNHNEHAALARAYLGKISYLTGLDLAAASDVCGSVMWVAHVNATTDNRGFEVVKAATAVQTADDIPGNWRDHLTVISGSRSKVLVKGVSDIGETAGDDLDAMTETHVKVPLDEQHRALIDWLSQSSYTVAWIQDHHLLQTHTAALKEYFELKKGEGNGLRGVFDTIAPATDPGKPNCFLRPKPEGAWDVYRFGQGTAEVRLWDTQGGWTHIGFNTYPTFEQIASASQGTQHPDPKQGYVFSSINDLQKALSMLNAVVVLPPRAEGGDRQLSLYQQGDTKKIVLRISSERTDKPTDFKGFVKTPKGWECLINEKTKIETSTSRSSEEIFLEVDKYVRALKQRNFTVGDISTASGTLAGWVVREEKEGGGGWLEVKESNVKSSLKAREIPNGEAMMGMALNCPWLLVTEPFRPEFPGGRVWNRNAPQFRFQPADLEADELPHHPWWDNYLNTLGKDLDQYIPNLPWCKEWNIRCGGDYLKAWVACMFRYPFDRLPYLFFYGPQGTGKSMFYESLSRLMTRGVFSGDKALTSDHNGELHNVVLAYIDEIDIKSAGKGVYNKVKAWLTAQSLPIHAKYHQVVEVRNCLHICQMSNDLASLPISLGDTRITAINVAPLVNPEPKDKFLYHLEQEAPHFMRTLMDMNIPEPVSRLRLEIIETASREAAIDMAASTVSDFISIHTHAIPGALIKFEAFYRALMDYARHADPTAKYSRGDVEDILLKNGLVIGTYRNQKHIANISLDDTIKPSGRYCAVNGLLVKEGQNNE